MNTLLRRLRSSFSANGTTTFCDACGQVCTAGCRSAAQLERSRARALLNVPIH